MVKNSDEFTEEDEDETFDIDEFTTLVDSYLGDLVEPLGIDGVWVTRHHSGGLSISFDTQMITNNPSAVGELRDARTALWFGTMTDYDDAEDTAVAIFEMLRDGLAKEQ